MLTTRLPAHGFPLISWLSEVHPQTDSSGWARVHRTPRILLCSNLPFSAQFLNLPLLFIWGWRILSRGAVLCILRVSTLLPTAHLMPAALQPPVMTMENILCEEGGDGVPVPQPEDLKDSCWHVLSLSSFVPLNCSLLLKSLTRG